MCVRVCVQSKGSIRSGKYNDFDGVHTFNENKHNHIHYGSLSKWSRNFKQTNVSVFSLLISKHEYLNVLSNSSTSKRLTNKTTRYFSLILSSSLKLMSLPRNAIRCYITAAARNSFCISVVRMNIFSIHFAWHCKSLTVYLFRFMLFSSFIHKCNQINRCCAQVFMSTAVVPWNMVSEVIAT